MTGQPGMAARADLGGPVRLTAGWQAGRPASLREHLERYGALPEAGRQALAAEVAAAGLTGRGGAGFPTGTKMRAVAAGRGPAVVVANGAESEPVSEKDQALLARAPHLVLDGIAAAAEAVGATEAHLCLSRTRGWLTGTVLAALGERQQAGLDRVPLSVQEIPHGYTSSEESSLVHWLNGGEAKPTTTPPRPFERGVGRRPTLVSNVETFANIALIARYGAAWYRSAGLAGAAGTMLTTVTGAVTQPGVFEVPAGTTVGQIMAMAGVAADVQALLIGGYFGTWHDMAEVARLPFTDEGLGPVGGSPGAGVLVALPAEECGLAEAARILRFLASQSAQQCGPCMFGLPAIAEDLTQLAGRRPESDPLERMQRRFGQISGRGACRHPDGAVRMAASALRAFAADAHAHQRRRSCLADRRRPQQLTSAQSVTRPGTEGGWQ
ncbi:MAG TPA: NADH-ubiquinone oxidoreductase-F iron-sulfur binding region domain-containing protein [Streptosporangiaceae bacterium]|jgi:NADH:ubiquinone oxidoreductase subunit F (NADH-binding)